MTNTALQHEINPLASLMFSLQPKFNEAASQDVYDTPIAHLTFYSSFVLKTSYTEGRQESKIIDPRELVIALSNLITLNTGILPPNVLGTGFCNGDVFLTVYLPPTIRPIDLKVGGKIKKYTLPTPGLIFSAWRKEMKLFAVKESEFKPSTPLFAAPFPNIHMGGKVCKGSVAFPIASAKTIYEMSNLFFQSRFNQDLAANKRKDNKSLSELWQQLDGQAEFPLEELMPTNHRLEELLKW